MNKLLLIIFVIFMISCTSKKEETQKKEVESTSQKITCFTAFRDFLNTAHIAGKDKYGWFMKPNNGIIYTWIKRKDCAVDFFLIVQNIENSEYNNCNFKFKDVCVDDGIKYKIYELTLKLDSRLCN